MSDTSQQQSRIKELIAKGREQGYLTYAEVNDHLPEDISDPDQVEDIIQMINDMGINVFETAPDADQLLLTTGEGTTDEIAAAEAAAALAASGALLLTEDLDEAVEFALAYAPEHLSIMTVGADSVARRVTTAGTTFVGTAASVAFGDYLTGGNHVLPTAGRARSFSGLGAQHFLRAFTIQEIDARGASALADDVGILADAEGLPAHAAAARARRGR